MHLDQEGICEMRLLHSAASAAATLASRRHARARSSTVHRELITVAARLAHRGRDQLNLHLPQHWPWQHAFNGLFDTTHRAPPARPRGLTRHLHAEHTPTAPAAHPTTTDHHNPDKAAEPLATGPHAPKQQKDHQHKETITNN